MPAIDNGRVAMKGQVYLYWNCAGCGLSLQVQMQDGKYVIVAMGRVVTTCPKCGKKLSEE